MKIIFFSHPDFFNSRSMTIYLQMLTDGMKNRGHQFEVWKPRPVFSLCPVPVSLKKWMGYVDQFIIFPVQVRFRLKNNKSSLFVFIDNALGPWVPTVKKLKHVIHCHDFIALNSAIGNAGISRVSWSGKIYQKFIRKGLMTGKNFISVSEKTKEDLQRILVTAPVVSDVVYNGLNRLFKPLDPVATRSMLSNKYGIELNNGYLMHLGGNLWYKNRKGVIEIYKGWRKTGSLKLPLILIGEKANEEIGHLIRESGYENDIHILSGQDDESVHQFYAGAGLFLFPSLEEGFGWPIAEAMACGCTVITTYEAPMTEVGAKAALYIPKMPNDKAEIEGWSMDAGRLIEKVIQFSGIEKQKIIQDGLLNAQRFDLERNLDRMELIYKRIVSETVV